MCVPAGYKFLLTSSFRVDIYLGGGEAVLALPLLLCERRAGMPCHLSPAHSSFDYMIFSSNPSRSAEKHIP